MNNPSLIPWKSAIRFSSIVPAFALAACGAETPVSEAQAEVDAPIEDVLPVMGPERVILGFGDSLMAGYNLEDEEGYPERLEAVMRARGINARVIDAGVSGDTTQAGRDRLAFVLDNLGEAPELAILELGGNDLLRQLSPEQTRANLEAMLQIFAERDIPVVLMGMRAPPNLGAQYQTAFDAIYPELAEQYGATLVPFFMEPIANNPDLLIDPVHPSAEGVEAMVAATVDTVIGALPEFEE